MANRIIICGGNGAGKSTLGKYLAAQLGCKFMDIEDYYFPKKEGEYPYEEVRTMQEVSERLLADLKRNENCVLAAVKGDYGHDIESLFTCAVFIEVPKEERMRRIRERSYKQFGSRMLSGGDLYEKETHFFTMADQHSTQAVKDWLKSISLPTITVNGLTPKELNTATIIRHLTDSYR